MTDRERIFLHSALWPDACERQGWDVRNRELKLQVCGTAVGREIHSTSEIGDGGEFRKVKNALRLLARPGSFDAAMRASEPDDADTRARYLFKVRKFPESYYGAIVKGVTRGKTMDPEELETWQLLNLVRRLETKVRKDKRERINAQLSTSNTQRSNAELEEAPF